MTENPTSLFGQFHEADPEAARFFWTGGPTEVAERTWFVSVFSSVTAFETDEGLVLVDSGTKVLAPGMAENLRKVTDAPVHTAVFTHGHVDHAYGLQSFLIDGQPPPRVVAQRLMANRFERYVRTSGHNEAINIRQFGGRIPRDGSLQGVMFEEPAIVPDTWYDDELVLSVGGVRFELHHGMGETDDATWVWCPDRKVLCPGDLFIWAVPNCGNPQKAQRYPWTWAAALREMAALEPEVLCPGHGGPVVADPEKINRMLVESAEYLESIVSQTLDALNDGSPPHVDVVHRVQLPTSESRWLQPIYDEGEFIVRNVLRHFGGWWSGRPCELKPAPRAAVASELARLAGGADRLAERASELAREGDFRLASHLADAALEAAPDDAAVQEAVASLYEQRAAGETSLMARNLFLSAAAYARAGQAFA